MSWEASWTIQPSDTEPPAKDTVDDPCRVAGSIIACENQSLGEVVALVGTPFRLHYQSDRVPGRTDALTAAVTHARQLGGWTLDVHHTLDPTGPTLFLGNGGRRSANALGPVTPTASGEFRIAAENGGELYVFDAAGRHLRTLHALTGAVRYAFSYDGAGRLTAVTDGDSNVTLIERDAAGVPLALVAPFGQRTTLTLDAAGYLARLTNPAGEAVQLSYAAGGLLTSLTDPQGHVYAFTYDASGHLLRDDEPAGGFKTLVRTDEAAGYTVHLSSALGRTTSFVVEHPPEGGERRLTTFPSGIQAAWAKDVGGTRITHFPDGTQMAVTPGSDPRWGLQVPFPQYESLTLPSGLTRTTTVSREVILADPADPMSLKTFSETVSLNGRPYTRLYDAATRTATAHTLGGRSLTLTLDALGRIVSSQNRGLAPISYNYDAHGQLITVTQGAGAEARPLSLGYTVAGELASLTDPFGHTTTFGHDAAGRIISQTIPDGSVLGYTYDANGNLIALTPPGRPAHTFAYTPVGRRATYSPPVVGGGAMPTLYTYDADQQLTLITRPDGQSVGFQYDTAGRLVGLTWPGSQVQQTYDPVTGHLTAITGPGAIGLTVSADGVLPTGEAWVGPVVGSVGFTYDADFRVAVQSLNGADPVSFTYDPDGLLLQAGALTLHRDPTSGLVTVVTLGNLTETLGYNASGEVTSASVAVGTNPLYTVQSTPDQLGRLVQRTEVIAGVTVAETFAYDVSGRLIEVTRNGAVRATYTYDSNGNRLSTTGPEGTATGSYDAQDRLLQYGSTTYTYTANGDLQSQTTGGQTTTYAYDALGNLLGVTLPDGTQLTYLVDGRNRRIGKQVNGALVQGFLYQDDRRPVAELDGAGQVISRFVYADHPNTPAYLVKAGMTYRLVSDHLGSPRLVVNTATGQVVQRLDYDAFGRVLLDTNPGFQPFGFAGGLYDSDTRLVRFGVRDYDAVIGRWTAKDPVLFAGGDPNLYRYVLNDPVNVIGPTGLDTYVCEKPLDALGGTNAPATEKRSGPEFKANPLYHKYLCVDRKGKITCVGLTEEHHGPFGPGALAKDTFVPERCEKTASDNWCLETCILSFGGNGPPPLPYYDLTYGFVSTLWGESGENCQQFADQVYDYCARNCNLK